MGRYASKKQKKSARAQAGQPTLPADRTAVEYVGGLIDEHAAAADAQRSPQERGRRNAEDFITKTKNRIEEVEKELYPLDSDISKAQGRLGIAEKKNREFDEIGLPEIWLINEKEDIGEYKAYIAKLQEKQRRLKKELKELKNNLDIGERAKKHLKKKPKKKKKKKGGKSKGESGTISDRRFQEQCFLIDNMQSLKKVYKEDEKREVKGKDKEGKKEPARESFENFTVLHGDNPQQFITKATMPRGAERLLTASPAELSRLVPSIKLWKVHYPDEKSDGKPIPFDFENHLSNYSIEQMTKNKSGRGSGAGIKSLEWDLQGTNLFEADKLISARMTLVFQDMAILNKVLKTTKDGYEIRYLDLFHANRKYLKSEGGKRVWNEKHFRIKATVGWAASEKDELSEAAKASGYTFFLSMIGHDINFNEDATIEVTIHYQALIESIMGDSRSDILLMSDNNTLSKLLEIQKEHFQDISNNPRANMDRLKRSKHLLDRQLEKDKLIEEELKKQIEYQRTAQYSKFLEKVEEKSKMYYIDVPNETIGIWKNSKQESIDSLVERRKRAKDVKAGKATKHGNWSFDLSKAMKNAKEKNKKENKNKFGTTVRKNKNTVRIHFMTLGGILDTALSVLGENTSRLIEVRTMVTDFEYIDPRGEGKVPVKATINLSEIPISLNLFQEWYYDECVSTERKTWKLKSFIKSLIDKMVISALSERCFPCVEPARLPRLNMIPIQLPLDSGNKCYITENPDAKPKNKPVHFEKIHAFKDDERRYSYDGPVGNYLFFHLSSMSQNLVAPKGLAEESKNIRNGIPSLYIGASRGLVKRISFQKEDNPQIKAFRITEGESQLGGMREIYNASVDMYGNNFFKPGSHVWIDASSSVFGAASSAGCPTVGQIIGLGGFYMILRVNSRIASGEYQTTLDCRWQSDGIPEEQAVRCLDKKPKKSRCEDGVKAGASEVASPAESEPSPKRSNLSAAEKTAKEKVLSMFGGDMEAYNKWHKSKGDKSINGWSKALAVLNADAAPEKPKKQDSVAPPKVDLERVQKDIDAVQEQIDRTKGYLRKYNYNEDNIPWYERNRIEEYTNNLKTYAEQKKALKEELNSQTSAPATGSREAEQPTPPRTTATPKTTAPPSPTPETKTAETTAPTQTPSTKSVSTTGDSKPAALPAGEWNFDLENWYSHRWAQYQQDNSMYPDRIKKAHKEFTDARDERYRGYEGK